MRTLPTAPFSTASWAPAVSSRGIADEGQAVLLTDLEHAVRDGRATSSAAARSASSPTV